jgi:hypothetical protein
MSFIASRQTADCLPARRVSSLQCSPLSQRRLFPKVWTLTLPSNHNTEQKNTHTKKAHQLFPPPAPPPSLPSCSLLDAVMLDVCYLQISILQLSRLWSWRHWVASVLHDFYVWLLLTRGKLLTQSAISSLYLLPWFFFKPSVLRRDSGLNLRGIEPSDLRAVWSKNIRTVVLNPNQLSDLKSDGAIVL